MARDSRQLLHQNKREAQIELMESLGRLVPACPGCAVFYEADSPTRVVAPSHEASLRCESGAPPHCTCDRCF